jgi:hypothetical protein
MTHLPLRPLFWLLYGVVLVAAFMLGWWRG